MMDFPPAIYQPTYMWLVFGLCVLMCLAVYVIHMKSWKMKSGM